MKHSKLIAGLAILVWAGSAFPQVTEREAVANVAQLSALGSVEVQQDVLSISMATARDGVDAALVQNQLKQALDAALTVAKLSVVPGQLDVRTGNFSLYPRYGRDGKISGWQGSTELVLEGRDFSRITATVGKIQTLTLSNVSFALSREQRARVEAEAQTQAIERFKTKALEVAKAFGFTGYTLREVSINVNDQGGMPRPRMMTTMAHADTVESGVPVEAGKSTVVVSASGSIQMK